MNIRIYMFSLATALTGCATVHNPDPLESLNRKTFVFNQKLDDTVLSPIAKKYRDNIPPEVRASVYNFYENPRDLISALSLFLQERPEEGMSDLLRFGANSFFGLFGLFDVATDLGYKKHGEDIGQTLGYWGMGPGAYIVWPLFGPSSIRDTTVLIGNLAVAPQMYISDPTLSYGLTGLLIVDTRSRYLNTSGMLSEISLDEYSFVRDAYLQRRKMQVYNGHAPTEDEAEF